ncbi:MAG: class I SAM-dependent methyltransferase [Granulosicoccaceae bacterium]
MAKQTGGQEKTLKHAVIYNLKILSGLALSVVMPTRKAHMERVATIPWHEQSEPDAIDRLIRTALLWQKSRDRSGASLASLHKSFWTQQSAEAYYAGTQSRFAKTFLPHFDHFLQTYAKHLQQQEIRTLIEIGCGDGQLLRHAKQTLPIDRAIGLDLSVDQIEKNNATNTAEGIEYHSGDARSWIADNAGSNTAYMTGLGVLEYFTEKQLSLLLGHIAAEKSPALALLIEPIDIHADLTSFNRSYVVGEEHSFTHNYPRRLIESGWKILDQKEVLLDDYRWLVVMAQSN